MTDEELKALVASNAQAIAGLAQRQDAFQSSLEEFLSSLEEIKQLVNSNARSIQAEATEARQHRKETRQAIRTLMQRSFENMTQHQDFLDAIADLTERLDRGQGAA